MQKITAGVLQEKPVNAYLPLFWAFIILCMLAGLRLTYQAIYKTSAFRSLSS
jgi:hypothetical protein